MDVTPENDAKALEYHAKLLSEVIDNLLRFHAGQGELWGPGEAMRLALCLKEDRKVVRRVITRLLST